MTRSQARAALSTLFNTTWGVTTPIVWDNTNPDTPTDAWVRFSVQHTTSEMNSWSGDRQNYLNYGIACVQVFTRIGSGTARSDQLCQAALTYLRGKDLGDLTTLTGSTIEDGPDGHGWWQDRVLVRFQYWDRAA